MRNCMSVAVRRLRALLLAAVIAVSGCAGQPSPDAKISEASSSDGIAPNIVGTDDYHDPLIGLNRRVFAFNDGFYRYLLIPAGRAYQQVTPDALERGIQNFFHNIKMPIHAVNHLLQGAPGESGKAVLRFGINSTVGIAGLFDPALDWFDIAGVSTGFEQTLKRHGSGYGAYLVLPLLGPSDVRAGAGVVIDWLLNPIPHLLPPVEAALVQSVDQVQQFAPLGDGYLKLHDQSADPYLFFRNLRLQGHYRDALYRSDDE